MNLKEMSMAEMVAMYNELSDTPVTRFADRKTAERRLTALIATSPVEVPESEVETLPAKKRFTAKDQFPDKKVAPAPASTDEVRQKMSAAQRKSWTDSEVREKRRERSAVEVDGAEYSSIAGAFKQLGVPMAKLCSFRLRLKEAGKLTEFGHKWEIVPLNY